MSNKSMCLCSFCSTAGCQCQQRAQRQVAGSPQTLGGVSAVTFGIDINTTTHSGLACGLSSLARAFLAASWHSGSLDRVAKTCFPQRGFLPKVDEMACDERVPAPFCGPHPPSSSCSSSSSMWSACPATRRGDHPRHTLQEIQLVLAYLLFIVIDLHRALIAASWKRFSFLGN